MSTKAQIQTQINTIQTGVLNTALRVREILGTTTTSFLENFYGLKLLDTNATTNVVTQSSSGLVYSVRVIKQGGAVRVVGTGRNATSAVTGANTVFFTITNTDYLQQTSAPEYPISHSAGTGENIRCVLTTNVFATFDPIGVNETFNIDFEYRTEA
tara:strand:- start:58 stop:525 length:468 start_codon:yes stop_codon:yes gene_type:complete